MASIDYVREKRLREYNIRQLDSKAFIDNEYRLIKKRKIEKTISDSTFSKKKTYEELSEMFINAVSYSDEVVCRLDNLLSSEIVDLYDFSLSIEQQYRKFISNRVMLDKFDLSIDECKNYIEIMSQVSNKLENEFLNRLIGKTNFPSTTALILEQSFIKHEPIKQKIKEKGTRLVKKLIKQKPNDNLGTIITT